MNPLDQGGLWDMPDDFGDEPVAESWAPAPAPAPAPTMTAPFDPVVDSSASVAPRRATATISSSTDFDNGVQFGMDPDFDFVGSRAVGAAFDLPGRDEVLRASHRPSEPRRGRGRSSRRDEELATTAVEAAAAAAGTVSEEGLSKKELREQRIAATKAKREERAAEKRAEREAKSADRAARRERKYAESSIGSLAGSQPDDSRNNRRLLIGATACAVVVAGAGIGGYMMIGGDGQSVATPPAPASSPASAQTPTSAVPPGSSCPSSTEGNVTTGNDAGSLTASGADTIKAFNYAYYTKRSSQAAVDAVMPSSVKPMFRSVDNLQSAIDALPQGTTHCLTITDLGNGLYSTELSQIPPGGGDPEIFKQRIQTARSGDKTLIVSNQVQ